MGGGRRGPTKVRKQAARRGRSRSAGPRAPRSSDAQLRTLFDGLADAYVRVSMDGLIEESNAAFRRMLGYGAAELRKRTYRDLTPERWHAAEARIVEEQIKRRHYSEVYEKEYRRKDGTVFPVELRTYLIVEGQRPVGMWAIVRDITERKRGEEALRRSELRFRTLAEGVPVGIYEVDSSGRMIFANRAAESMAGIGPGAGASAPWRAALHPEDRDRVVREWYAAVSSGAPCELEYRFRHENGDVRLVRSRATPLHDAEGRGTGFLGAMLDLTEQRAMEAQVQSSHRLAALGTLVAGIAHEVNNPLGAMLLSLGLVRGELRGLRALLASGGPIDAARVGLSFEMLEEALARAGDEGERVSRIVKDLNVVGRPDSPQTRVRLGAVVDKAMYWLAPSLGEHVAVRVEQSGTQEVLASEGQLVQVLVNLVTNAVRSIPEGRRGQVVVRAGPGAAGMARIEVQDDGEGMTPEVMARMFDPFFSTRSVGQGMGLGLSVCHAIVTMQGGTIRATSEVGRGSTFVVDLPLAPARA
jgi:PAS domain S-box-containing protein